MTDEPKTPTPDAEATPPAETKAAGTKPEAPAETKAGADKAAEPTEGKVSAAKDGKDATADEKPAPPQRIPPARARWGLRLLVLLILLLIAFALLWWKHCFPGKGGGGRDSASDSGPAAMAGRGGAPAKGAACLVRVDAKGITVAGQPAADPATAIKACGEAKRAVLTVTGDATFGRAAEVEKALRAAGITVQRQR